MLSSTERTFTLRYNTSHEYFICHLNSIFIQYYKVCILTMRHIKLHISVLSSAAVRGIQWQKNQLSWLWSVWLREPVTVWLVEEPIGLLKNNQLWSGWLRKNRLWSGRNTPWIIQIIFCCLIVLVMHYSYVPHVENYCEIFHVTWLSWSSTIYLNIKYSRKSTLFGFPFV